MKENKNKSYAGKWILKGYTKKERNIIYQRLRSKAKGIITKKYNKEYCKILTNLIKEYLKNDNKKF